MSKNEDGPMAMLEMECMDETEGKQADVTDENPERGNWSNKAEFLLTCLGYAVGLGNLWRFPYMCFKNGGGTFLIPYALMFFVIALPLFFLEIGLGQFSSSGCVSVWNYAPLFRGVGITMLIGIFFGAIYYCVILAWSIFYFFASFSDLPSVPWARCGHYWNTDRCIDYLNATAVTSYSLNGTTTTASAEYFNNFVLNVSTGIEDTGHIRWHLALSLLLAWIIVYLCIVNGIKSAGKVVYVTATLPYILIIILVVRGCTLEGAWEGIHFYIGRADWSKLKNAGIWRDAASQLLLSVGVSIGPLYTMASYNKFHNNIVRDSIVVSSLNSLTSILAGFAIFPMIGHMAHKLGKNIEEVAVGGPGLAFDVYPAILSTLPASPFFSAVFFLALITLGVDSLFVIVETVTTAFLDEIKFMSRRRTFWKRVVPMLFCIATFLLGLPHVTQAGIYWVNLADAYAIPFLPMIIGIIECLVVIIFYGISRFLKDVQAMIGHHSRWFKMMLIVVFLAPLFAVPVVLALIFAFYWVEYKPPTLGRYTYPDWAIILGWLMTFSSLSAFVLYIPYHLICKETGPLWQRLANSVSATSDWGPAINKFRKEAGYGPVSQRGKHMAYDP